MTVFAIDEGLKRPCIDSTSRQWSGPSPRDHGDRLVNWILDRSVSGWPVEAPEQGEEPGASRNRRSLWFS